MKNIFLLIMLFTAFDIIPQNQPISSSEFPKIGFRDMYSLKKHPLYYYGQTNYVDYSDSSYYYPALLAAGITHVVTYGDDIPFNPDYNQQVKISGLSNSCH